MKKTHAFIEVLFFMIILNSCSGTDNTTSSQMTKVADGIYLVLNEYNDSLMTPDDMILVPYSHDFLDSNEDEPDFLEIDTTDFVSLELATEPEGVEQPDQRLHLLLTLNAVAAERLADFTEKNLNKRVAIVIGGKAVTMHKVRSRIEGGKLQITRCTDNACEHLLLELKDNVKN